MSDEHNFETCDDTGCPRLPCIAFKAGLDYGFSAGYAAGETAGEATGYAAGYAAASG